MKLNRRKFLKFATAIPAVAIAAKYIPEVIAKPVETCTTQDMHTELCRKISQMPEAHNKQNGGLMGEEYIRTFEENVRIMASHSRTSGLS